LAAEDADAETLGGIGSVEDFDFGATGDEEKFFVGAEEGDAEVVLGGLAILQFDEHGFVHGEEDVVGAGFVLDDGDLPGPFRERSEVRGGGAQLGLRRASFGGFHRGDEAVAAAGKRFDVARLRVRIAERHAQSADRGIHTVLEVHKSVRRPELRLHFLTGDEFAGIFEEHGQDLKRPAGEAELAAVLPELVRVEIHFVGAEARVLRGLIRCRHSAATGAGGRSVTVGGAEFKRILASVCAKYLSFMDSALYQRLTNIRPSLH
jgi:hypothetical protein